MNVIFLRALKCTKINNLRDGTIASIYRLPDSDSRYDLEINNIINKFSHKELIRNFKQMFRNNGFSQLIDKHYDMY
jgi:hypothetical protein